MSKARELVRTRRGRMIAIIVPIQVSLAILAWRDLNRRADSQVRGTKRIWRVFVLMNPGNAAFYWLIGRR